MATYPNAGVYEFMRRNYLYNYPLNGGYDCQTCWADLLSASEAEYLYNISYSQFGSVGAAWLAGNPINSRHYRNFRASARFNLAGLSPENVEVAYLRSQGGWISATSYGVAVRMHDGSHLSGDKHDYGEIADGEFLGGTLISPFGLDANYPWIVHFNAAGISFLKSKAGGYAWIGFISDTYPYPPPGCPGTTDSHQHLYLYYDPAKCYINTDLKEGGYIWVEGDDLAYLDAFRTKRTKEGSLTGNIGIAGHCWVEGNYLHYIDSSGNERRILGTATGISGKIAGQISINTYWGGGRNLCYIDSSGHERCFWDGP